MRIRAIAALPVIAAALLAPSGAQASAVPLNQWHLVNPWGGIGPLTVLATSDGSIDTLTFGRFAHSTDGGVTASVTSAPPCYENTMAVDPADTSRIYIGCRSGGGMLRSTDGGATWTADNTGLMYPGSTVLPTISAIAVDPADSSVYVTTEQDELGADIFASNDGGDTWTPIHDGFWANGIAVSDGRIFADEAGVITSDDGGASWSTPAAADGGGSLVADPDHPGTVYALAWPTNTAGRAWVTTDGGDQWMQLGSAPSWITSASVADGDVYLGTHSGVYRSSDHGVTWTQTETSTNNGQLQITAVAADPSVPGHVWAMDDNTGLLWDVTFDQNLVPGLVPYYSGGTLPATDVTPTSAVLHGVIEPTGFGISGGWIFFWGVSPIWDQHTPEQPWPDGSPGGNQSEVEATLTGLEPGTTYHYQLQALSSFVSAARSDDVSFTTPPAQPPSVGDMAVSFRHAAASDAELPVELRWSATAGTYGRCSTTLQLSTDGGTFRAIAHPGPRARRYDTTLEPGHSYVARVRTGDCHGLRSSWGSAAFALRPPAARHTAFGRSWQAAAGVHSSSTSGARARLVFTGHEAGIVALTGRAYGTAAVCLDGEQVATLHLHARHPAQRRLVFRAAVATPGRHTLVVRVLGGSVAIGQFAVLR